MTLELCIACEAPTGRAGWGEDSLYAIDDGPYCEDCWSDLPIQYAEELLSKQADYLNLRDRAEKAEAERDEANETIKDEFKVGFNYAVEAALIELSEADSLELTMHGITPAMTRVLNLKKGADQWLKARMIYISAS